VLRSKIYNEIVDAFEQKYFFLGKQFAEEFLLTAASRNIQDYSEPDFRVRRHLLLYWQCSWLKSSLLHKARHLLGRELCMGLSDISNAALRGTVEAGRFISPYTLKRPFAVCTEFGQVVNKGDSSELVQKLLNVLEEGEVEVSLGKISLLTPEERIKAEEKWGIYFIDSNTFPTLPTGF